MNISIESGILVIKVPIDNALPLSKSGKTRIVYTSGGFIPTQATIDGKPVSVGLNVIVPK
jgi:hypothetical protein